MSKMRESPDFSQIGSSFFQRRSGGFERAAWFQGLRFRSFRR